MTDNNQLQTHNNDTSTIDFETAMKAQERFERKYYIPMYAMMIMGILSGAAGIVAVTYPDLYPWMLPGFPAIMMLAGTLCLLYVAQVRIKISQYGCPNCPELDEYYESQKQEFQVAEDNTNE